MWLTLAVMPHSARTRGPLKKASSSPINGYSISVAPHLPLTQNSWVRGVDGRVDIRYELGVA